MGLKTKFFFDHMSENWNIFCNAPIVFVEIFQKGNKNIMNLFSDDGPTMMTKNSVSKDLKLCPVVPK